MIYIGIDNGLKGGIVAIEDDTIILKTTMPIIPGKRKEYDIPEIVNIFSQYKDKEVIVGLEKSLIMPVSGRISIASTSCCFGMFQGILSAFQMPFQIIRPSDWQKAILKGTNAKDTKQASIMWCRRMYPKEDWRASKRSTKYHDGLCDACCIANYLRENRR